MNKLLLLFALVAAASAASLNSENDLLKRILQLVEAKRELSVFSYNPDGKKLMVSYKVCVRGDRSKVPCRSGVKGHSLKIFDSAGQVQYATSEQYLQNFGGPHKVYTLPFVKDGETYKVTACEINAAGKDVDCNDGSFTGGKNIFGFGGKGYDFDQS